MMHARIGRQTVKRLEKILSVKYSRFGPGPFHMITVLSLHCAGGSRSDRPEARNAGSVQGRKRGAGAQAASSGRVVTWRAAEMPRRC